jgi:hypothetical protein
MKIMAYHGSAQAHEATPHAINSTKNNLNGTSKNNISDALKRRAQSIIKDKSIDAHSRAFIRYGLEINDPWLAELVRRVDAGESIIDNFHVDSDEEKIEKLSELICRAGDEASAALLVLMATLENSTEPKALANTAKHLAFTRCGELNLDRIVAMLESQVLAMARV